MLLEISQNSQENTYAAVSFLIKLQASDLFLIKFTEHLWTTASVLRISQSFRPGDFTLQ